MNKTYYPPVLKYREFAPNDVLLLSPGLNELEEDWGKDGD